MKDELLNSTQSADLAQIAKSTFWKWQDTGAGPAPVDPMLSKWRWKWRKADIEKMVEELKAEKEMLSSQMASDRIGLSKSTLQQMVKTGHFPAPVISKFSRKHLWRAEEVDSWSKHRPAKPPSPAPKRKLVYLALCRDCGKMPQVLIHATMGSPKRSKSDPLFRRANPAYQIRCCGVWSACGMSEEEAAKVWNERQWRNKSG